MSDDEPLWKHHNAGNQYAVVENPKIYRLVARCDLELKTLVLQVCKNQDITETDLVTQAVQEWLKPLDQIVKEQ